MQRPIFFDLLALRPPRLIQRSSRASLMVTIAFPNHQSVPINHVNISHKLMPNTLAILMRCNKTRAQNIAVDISQIVGNDPRAE